jgi:hypothetical protein
LNLDDEGFYQWAVKKIARDTLIEDRERFVDQFPPEELKHIYTVLDTTIIPALAKEGVPITREELRALLRTWFVKQASPVVKHPTKSPDYGAKPRKRVNLEYIGANLPRRTNPSMSAS